MLVPFPGTTFCGNSPVEPSLLNLVQNEVSQLSSNLNDFLCQYKEERELLESRLLDVKQSLEEFLKLPQKVEQIELEVEGLRKQVADLSSNSIKSECIAKHPTVFGVLARNEYFTGRSKELQVLEKAFDDFSTKPDVHVTEGRNVNVHGICGLGGCGKSSLAFEYAWRNMERYPGGVFVVNGESDDLVRTSIQEIYGEFVNIAPTNQRGEAKSFEQVLNETLSWLGNLREKSLLFVDNMDQKELSPCTRKIFLGHWKNKSLGDILVTSRRSSQALCEDLDLPSEKWFELDPFSVDESVEFLKKRTGITSILDNQDQGEKELAQELGGLPLALEQAAAYIKALDCSIALYLQQYHLQKSTLLNTKRAKPRTEIYSEERLAVETTWLLNFNYIENGEKDKELGRAAAFFMKISAYLSPDEIPFDVLNIGAPKIENVDLKKRLELPIGVQQIVDLLTRFSLFKRKSNDTLSVHRLVQETLRDHCDEEGETDNVLSSAVRMMHKTFLDCVGGTDFFWDLYDKLNSQVKEKASHFGQFMQLVMICAKVPLEEKRWKNLSLNAFHLVCLLLERSSFKRRFVSEESARLFCEAALYCYSLRMENEGQNLQQLVLEIVCAIREPLRYYKDDALKKVTRILRPFTDSALLSQVVMDSSIFRRNVFEGNRVPTNPTQTGEISEAIKRIAPKAREAFSRGDFETSADLFTDIVQVLNFEAFRGPFKENEIQRHLVPLGEILCHRGIAHLKMGNFESAVDDFNTSTYVDIKYYRSYYWKAYALCTLVENGRSEFYSRAQAATAVLHYKFARSKPNDIRKLQKKFPALLKRIDYKFVSEVRHLKELESRPPEDGFSNAPLTIILAGGNYHLKEIRLLGGRYYFVCPPGSSALINCIKGLYLTDGSFLFENVTFVNCYFLVPAITYYLETGQVLPVVLSRKESEEFCASMNLDSLMLGRPRLANTEPTAGTERNFDTFIEADDVHSLVIDHCDIIDQPRTGIAVTFNESSHEQRSVSVRSSRILCCGRTGLRIQGNASFCHIIIHDNSIVRNLYGIVIDSPSCFCLEKNYIFSNSLSGVVAIRTSGGKLLRNSLVHNGNHGILFNKATALMEGNSISNNRGWAIVCSHESNLQCKENVLEHNLCGGLRMMFNGKGNVTIEKCEFRENSGPAVFPENESELCEMEFEGKQLFAASNDAPLPIHLRFFLEDTAGPNCASIREFKAPVLRNNIVSDITDIPFYIEATFCSTCSSDRRMDSDLIKCPSCHIARFCDQQCFAKEDALHHSVCNSILEANKEVHVCCDISTLSEVPLPDDDSDQNGSGLSMCVVCTLTATQLMGPQSDLTNFDTSTPNYFCFLVCPQRHLWTSVSSPIIHGFILKHGIHITNRMTNTKAACILAKFDPGLRTVILYKHRIFSLEEVPDALEWVKTFGENS